jgi:hypothetical protein
MSLHLQTSAACFPGFGLTLGYTVFYLSLIVLIPLGAMFVKTASMSFAEHIWAEVSNIRVSSLRIKLTLTARRSSAHAINLVFGFIAAWMPRSLQLPRASLHRCDGRPALRDADLRFSGIALVDDLLQEGLDRPAPGADWGSRPRIAPIGRHDRVHVHRSSPS